MIVISGARRDDGDEEPCVVYRSDGTVGFIELNRPRRRNALSADVLVAFHAALDQFAADVHARVAVLSGRGPTFCAGFDLSRDSASVQSTAADPWSDRARLRRWVELGLRIWEFPRPIIAQIHGHCLAGGIMLALCSDIVFISDDCVVGWARLPMGAGFLDGAMSHVVGARRAKEISFLVGSRITGRDAADWGFANRAIAPELLEREAHAYARRLARTPRNVLEVRKAAITRVNAGFREALLAGVEWDALAHVDRDVLDFRRLVRDHGMANVIEAFENTDDPFAALEADRKPDRAP